MTKHNPNLKLHTPNVVRSMTSFARKQNKGEWGTITIEMRTVNHRFLDITLRMPEALRAMDTDVRELIRNTLTRGKVEVNVRFEPGEATTDIKVNKSVAEQLSRACEELGGLMPGESHISITEIMQMPGVLQTNEPDESILKPAFLSTVEETLTLLQETREREGSALSELIESRLAGIEAQVQVVRPHQEQVLAAQREKILTRIEDAKVNIDENRLEQEMVMWAQRADITEELDRLDTHVKEVRRTLQKGGAIGRRLDFLMQELNREANTLSSKSVSVVMTNAAVEMKVLIEQMREQVQNIE